MKAQHAVFIGRCLKRLREIVHVAVAVNDHVNVLYAAAVTMAASVLARILANDLAVQAKG